VIIISAWNVGVFQNDTGDDVKTEYIELLKEGNSTEEANRMILENNRDVISSGDYDELEFWLALASIQWDYGRLSHEVKDKALQCLQGDWHLEPWKEDSPKLVGKRVEVINAFVTKITSPQPEEKKVKPYKSFICPWNIGDIFAYRFESEESKEKGYYGKYAAFQKVRTAEAYPKLTIPVLHVAKKVFDKIPTVEEFLSEPTLQQFWGPESYDQSIPARHGQIKVTTALYNLAVVTSSSRSYPKNIFYIGNSNVIKLDYKEAFYDEHQILNFKKDFEYVFFLMYEIWKDVDIKKFI
jgi:hypothetical protein